MKLTYMSQEKALDALRKGSVLLCMNENSPEGYSWFVIPGGRVRVEDVDVILKHPKLEARKDGLFPGISQTYRMRPSGPGDLSA